MKIATLVYKHYLASTGIGKMVWSLVRKALIKLLHDPICSLLIHGRLMKLPLSHPLPSHLVQFRFYDRLPERIAEYVRRKYGHLSCIDVGANIGDTIASFYKKETDIFLAVEPNPKFNKLLTENWGWNDNVTVVSDICAACSDEGAFVIHEKDGTASIIEMKDGKKMRRRRLDEIVDDHAALADANILKVDTDGCDFEVIEGAQRLLSRNLPVVLFECDAFGNASYVEDCLRSLKTLEQAGYHHFLLYDNFGSLMGRYSFADLSSFQNLLFFQLTSDFYYFDILVMKDEDIFRFYAAEIDYFTDKMSDKSLQRTARAAGLRNYPDENMMRHTE